MFTVKGSPGGGLIGATVGFFVGFAAVSLFGPTTEVLKDIAGLKPALAGLLVSIPSLSGSLLRIFFSAMVDTTGGRKPFIILLILSAIGVLGIFLVLRISNVSVTGVADTEMIRRLFPLLLIFGVLGGCGIATFSVGISQTSYWFPASKQGTALGAYAGIGNLAPGIFAALLSSVTIPLLGLTTSYLLWLGFLILGTGAYLFLGRNAAYFQIREQGVYDKEARKIATKEYKQELFPKASILESLKASISLWQTWALIMIYFTTFGGFMALTAWLPNFFASFHAQPLAIAGSLAALYSIIASLIRIAGGSIADRIGGERTAMLALFTTISGAVIVVFGLSLPAAISGVIVMALGMGIGNAAVFKLVPQEVPRAVGGAAGWVGGLGAFGGFVIPNLLAAFITSGGSEDIGFRLGFIVFIGFALLSLTMVYLLKRSHKGTS